MSAERAIQRSPSRGGQSVLRARLARLEAQQVERIKVTGERKQQMDDVIARKQLEITNLKAQLTIGLAR